MTTTTARIRNPATWWQRWPLRCIGLGVILLTDDRWRNLVRYFGCYWNVGCWAIAEYPILHPVWGSRDA